MKMNLKNNRSTWNFILQTYPLGYWCPLLLLLTLFFRFKLVIAVLIRGLFGARLSPAVNLFCKTVFNTIFFAKKVLRRFSAVFRVCPGNKVKINLNIVVDNSSMYINVGNANGFVKVYSGPYRVYGVETLTGIPMTLSSLLTIVYFPEEFFVLDDRWSLEYDSGFLCLM